MREVDLTSTPGLTSADDTLLVLRPLQRSDVARVTAIYNAAVRDSPATMDTEEKSEADFETWLEHHDERYAAIGAFDDEGLVGYAALSPFAARGGYQVSAEISIYLHPAHAGRRVGSMLAAALVEHGRTAGFTTILSLTTSTNVAPQRIVENLGFVRTGTLHHIGYKLGQLVSLVCHQLFFEEAVARCGGTAEDVDK